MVRAWTGREETAGHPELEGPFVLIAVQDNKVNGPSKSRTALALRGFG